MKRAFKLIGILPLLLLFSSCCFYGNCDDEPMVLPNQFTPVIVSRASMESAVSTQPPTAMIKSGKIYIKGDLMFITDVNKGFHVYNYSDAENPVKTAFITAPGATDLAIKNNIIYINQAVDLLTINYDATNNIILSAFRNRNVFPTKPAPNGQYAYTSDDEIVIDWIQN